MYREIKRNNPEVHFHNYVLVPGPTAWLVLLERGWGVGGRKRKQREINTSVQTALPPPFLFLGEGGRGMARTWERDGLAPVATVPARVKGKRCCKMNKLLCYLPGWHNFLTVWVMWTPTVRSSAHSKIKRNQSGRPSLFCAVAQRRIRTPRRKGSMNSCTLP